MSQTSIHFLEVKSTSEIHNFRKKKFEYCREDLLHLNEHFTEESISERMRKIEAECKKYSGRKLQKNAKPIREGVVVIHEKTTMNDLKKLAHNLQKELGIKVFQIFIHRDEGHYDDNKIWKTNQHAHLVAEWIDFKTVFFVEFLVSLFYTFLMIIKCKECRKHAITQAVTSNFG